MCVNLHNLENQYLQGFATFSILPTIRRTALLRIVEMNCQIVSHNLHNFSQCARRVLIDKLRKITGTRSRPRGSGCSRTCRQLSPINSRKNKKAIQ
nr:MAG TPA: hypothetical protein [Bacteriophage sp.]